MHKLLKWSQFLIKILIKQLMSTVFLLEAVKKNRVRPVADSNNLMYRVQIKKYNKTFSLNSLAQSYQIQGLKNKCISNQKYKINQDT